MAQAIGSLLARKMPTEYPAMRSSLAARALNQCMTKPFTTGTNMAATQAIFVKPEHLRSSEIRSTPIALVIKAPAMNNVETRVCKILNAVAATHAKRQRLTVRRPASRLFNRMVSSTVVCISMAQFGMTNLKYVGCRRHPE